jgi:hypothetical protein
LQRRQPIEPQISRRRVPPLVLWRGRLAVLFIHHHCDLYVGSVRCLSFNFVAGMEWSWGS